MKYKVKTSVCGVLWETDNLPDAVRRAEDHDGNAARANEYVYVVDDASGEIIWSN
jgi:hypothetical protein